MIREVLAGDLEEEHRDLIDKIYFRNDAECMRGRQAHRFYHRLKGKSAAVNEQLSTAILE